MSGPGAQGDVDCRRSGQMLRCGPGGPQSVPGNEAPAKARAGRWLFLLLSWETPSVETARSARPFYRRTGVGPSP